MNPKRILVVDDKEENRYLLRVLLENAGFAVTEAPHGAEALEQARRERPDLVVSDILMPVMDGFALCREWKRDEALRATPFAFYTATYTDGRDRDFARSIGADDFIVKPMEPDELVARLRTLLQAGARPGAPGPASGREEGFLRQYNETLVRKLEAKMEQLEQDLATRKRMEQELKDSEDRFRALHNASFGGIAIHDQGRILECNQGLSDITGYSYGELIGMDGLLLISAGSRDQVVRNIQAGYEKPYEAEGVRKDGAVYPLRLEAKNIPYKGKNVRVVEFRDVSETKRAEKEKEHLESQLYQAQKMESVGRLAGGVAHDFNNMLGVILGHAEMALEQMEPGQPCYDDWQEVRKAAERSAALTRQLLAFARKQTIAPKIIDLNETVEGMLKMLRRLIGEDIDLDWHPGQPLAPIKVDPSQIDQILANLCVNARDAIADVGKVTIETGAVSFDEAYCAVHAGFLPGDYVLLAVSDNGCGMPPETVRHLFEPFFTTKEKGQGTGLGLASVYGAVKQNNGFLNVYSEPGQGTTFKIYLPQHPVGTPRSAAAATAQPAARGSETILLVEDEPGILRLAALMLESQGYAVIAAQTPGEAIRLALEHRGPIHLLMTDVVMPEMNGRVLAKNLLSTNPNLKRLFMSGYTANVIAHHGVLDPGVHFIQKPFSLTDLSAKIREALDA